MNNYEMPEGCTVKIYWRSKRTAKSMEFLLVLLEIAIIP